MAAIRRTGRPSKGDRVVVYARPHRVIADRLKSDSEAAGISQSDYVALLLAKALELDEFAPELPHSNGQEVLPLGRTA
ncbi:MAG: hypothetical protein INR63_24025 [Actinomycetospora chiangmaiensis]|nr:hypothetical protein [Actinomycetospora chiangmaiensis]